ncbi:glycoside hydrolase family 43 protein [Hymenobacter sp. 5516J-16]|uniref:glycoside hydrolase family 43 protein n=1 Tax=Hymenobacter sp. 5516J-16 TaxID=2932253 RepID=UPI001FD4F365|nr:glycoside hydrolase family 43 protein [Hymenobacter sp. 5516J-16]UOQ76007.1 glycoside hydrolase family 43 protein [Hymenobacter sp. 5516J-16]
MLFFRSFFWASLLLVGTLACSKSSPSITPTPTPPTAPTTTTFTNPLLSVGPDPWVVRRGDVYYYMSTTGGNLVIRKTAKMSELGSAVSTVVWTPQQAGINQIEIWAPELHFLNGKWYIYYSANPLCCDGHRIFVLENSSADPTTGTWVDKGRIAVPGQDLWAIDGTVLEQNGKRYLLWSGHEVARAQTQRIYIAEMSNPWTLVGSRVELSKPEFSWEQLGDPDVNEGPEILKRGDKTFVVYSASHCSTDDYALGLLTASATADPLKLSSWTKTPTPVFVKNPAGRAFGPGHNGFFQSKDGTEDWIIYHANPQAGQGCGDNRSPRMQKFTWKADGTPDFGTPVALGTALPKPAGE